MAVLDRSILPILGLRPTGDLGPITIYTSRRKKPVCFPRTTPKQPQTPLQRWQRARYKQAAAAWSHLPPTDRDLWTTAARTANLHISGYNLWTWHRTHPESRAIHTIERHANTTLPAKIT